MGWHRRHDKEDHSTSTWYNWREVSNRSHRGWVVPSSQRIKEWIGQELKFDGGDDAFLTESVHFLISELVP